VLRRYTRAIVDRTSASVTYNSPSPASNAVLDRLPASNVVRADNNATTTGRSATPNRLAGFGQPTSRAHRRYSPRAWAANTADRDHASRSRLSDRSYRRAFDFDAGSGNVHANARTHGPSRTPSRNPLTEQHLPHPPCPNHPPVQWVTSGVTAERRTVPPMIGYLTGTFRAPDLVVTDTGVGYQVALTTPPDTGETVELYVETVVRENDISLFGFTTRQEQALFAALVTLPKVGPKAALALLRDVGAATVVTAITAQDPQPLTGAAGVGPRLAASIAANATLPTSVTDAYTGDNHAPSPAPQPVIDALIQLGYPEPAARAAAREAAAEQPEAELPTLVRRGIQLCSM